MGANSVPRFTESPIIGIGQVTVANANRDGTGTLVTVATGTTHGTLIESVRVKAIVTTTAGMVRLFIDDGSNVRLIGEILVSAITVSATVAAFVADWTPPSDLILPDTWELQASTENAEAMNVIALGGNY
jgi:hypothetical protein